MIYWATLRGCCLLVLLLLAAVPFATLIFNMNPAVASIPLFASPPRKNISIWSSDFHISPVADIKDVLAPLGASLLDKSLSGHCHLTQTCQTDLRVINQENGIELSPCPNELHRQFYDTYVDDKEFRSTDAILCTHACSMCEMFMAFGKPLIVISSTRYEIGRMDARRWQEWNRNLRRIASHPNNVVAANNKYDLEYMKYFTGLNNIEYLPSYCGYVKAKYNPSRKELLIAPGRGTNSFLVGKLQSAAADAGVPIYPMRDVYPTYEYEDLAAHPAFVLMPYQVSFMLFFELYRMGVPMFVPAPRLLAKWHVKLNVLGERTWNSAIYQTPARASNIQRHPDSTSKLMKDPNNDVDYDSVLEWIKLADFYEFPHVATFDSFEHLMSLLKSSNLEEISSKMEIFNVHQQKYINSKWSNILNRIQGSDFPFLPAFSNPSIRSERRDFDVALREEYGAKLDAPGCVGSSDVSNGLYYPVDTFKDFPVTAGSVSPTGGAFRSFNALYFLSILILSLLVYAMCCNK